MRPAAESEEREGAAGSAGDLKKGKKHEFVPPREGEGIVQRNVKGKGNIHRRGGGCRGDC